MPLTKASKVLIGLTIVSVVSAAVWQFGIKGFLAHRAESASGTPGTSTPGTTATTSAPVVTPASGPLGSAGNPLKVSLVSFHGYAPGLSANGDSLDTKAGSLFDQQGVHIKFVLNDDIPTLTTLFESGSAQCAWRTSDFWAQEQPNLRNAAHDGRAVMIVDNTRGADAVIARDPSIQSIEDLTGHSVALLQFTPSHGLLIDALNNSSLSAKKREAVKTVFVQAEDGTAGVRAAFEAGHVDAAVLWDPDLSLALRAPGAHVVYSTKIATDLIYDVMVCDKKVLDDPANQPAIQGFVAGWLGNVDAVEHDRTKGVSALKATEDMFGLLAKKEGDSFISGLFDNIDLTDLADNARILGRVAGGTNNYERVYHQFDGIYRGLGALANPNSPVITPSDSFDYRYVDALLAKDSAAKATAAVPQFSFTPAEAAKADTKPAAMTKPVTINFESGSSELTKKSQQTIDTDMVPLIQSNGSAYFEISGNTDSTGARATNVQLSKARASAVEAYLVHEWEFPAARFVLVGNGPDKPLCNESKPDDGVSIDDCRASNRTTRVAVLAR